MHVHFSTRSAFLSYRKQAASHGTQFVQPLYTCVCVLQARELAVLSSDQLPHSSPQNRQKV